jgi:hypothetical protein
LTGRGISDLSAESDVSSFTPGGVPRVLDDVIIRSVTNSKNTVVKVSSTASIRVDTRLVKLEGLGVGLDSNRDWLVRKSVNEGGIVVLGDVLVSLNSGSLGARGGASALNSLVWVSSFSAKTTVLGNPVEGVVHPATVAASVRATVAEDVAINQVLFRKRSQSVAGNSNGTFNGTSGGEGPARAALALVLDTSNGTGRSPIHRGWGSKDSWFSMDTRSGSGLWAGTIVNIGLPLVQVHVGKLVVANSEGRVARVVGFDEIVVVGEVLKHLDEVFSSQGLDSVVRQPREELAFIESTIVNIASKGNSGNNGENRGTERHL